MEWGGGEGNVRGEKCMWVGEGEGGRRRVSVELPNFRTEGNSRPDPWEYIPNYPEYSLQAH